MGIVFKIFIKIIFKFVLEDEEKDCVGSIEEEFVCVCRGILLNLLFLEK